MYDVFLSLATGTDENFARVWAIDNGGKIAEVMHTDRVNAVRFSPNGQLVASASSDRSVRLWDASSGQIKTVLAHPGPVSLVEFGRNDRVATAGSDNTARVWNLEVATGDEVRFDLGSPGRAVSFTADGQKLTTVTLNGTVGTWNLLSADLAKEACARLPRNLNRDEWRTYIGDDVLSFRSICPLIP